MNRVVLMEEKLEFMKISIQRFNDNNKRNAESFIEGEIFQRLSSPKQINESSSPSTDERIQKESISDKNFNRKEKRETLDFLFTPDKDFVPHFLLESSELHPGQHFFDYKNLSMSEISKRESFFVPCDDSALFRSPLLMSRIFQNNIENQEKTNFLLNSQTLYSKDREGQNFRNSLNKKLEEFKIEEGQRSYRNSSVSLKEKRASIRDTSVNVRKIFQPENLFENFLVIGITKKDATEYINSLSVKNAKKDKMHYCNSNILFDFAESVKGEQNVTPEKLERFLAPKLSLIDKGNKINITDKLFYKVVMKSQRKYSKRYISPFNPHTIEIHISKWHKDIQVFNPQNRLYAMWIKKGDFIIVEDENKISHFLYVESIYCFLTYYPIPSLMFDLLTSILSLIRKVRKELYFDVFSNLQQKVDFTELNQILRNEVGNYLKSLCKLPLPKPFHVIDYPLHNDKNQKATQSYFYDSSKDAYLELVGWNAVQTFNIFSLENIKFLITALLLEKFIVFFSEDMGILSSTLNTLFGLITPFKYMFPVIPSLPPDLIRMCSSPVPLIIGINDNEESFKKNNLAQYTDIIFVFIDSQKIYTGSKNRGTLDVPILNFGEQEIYHLYQKLNHEELGMRTPTGLSHKNQIPLSSPKDENPKKSQVETSQNEENHKIYSEQILRHFRDWLDANIIHYIKQLKELNPSNTNDEIKNKINDLIQEENVRNFFHLFTSTQGFASYPDSISSAQLVSS